ncbi:MULTISPECIES: response regulator [Methylobacterium]|uniref:Response regulator receiver domain-containing protein n=1 Tax=Methylobacterium phyllosphaerae TaxID=418223 RepID=A0AAE8HS71_9HYPH|nr:MULTISPECIES: response regulator [Methylobacterium]KOX58915.1 response regulator receiver protein [Streptomyces purpurogeneiscleroticus]APT34193.1 response regulator receiver protein [Methylobacterium phyllosphaerae]MBP29718.1 response regulator [Methylobacterium sp.]MDE4910031.1 response regulator [Methylobacterium sp. 092160098-2]MDH3029671.1 response regulator [Methylobacterium fujisawaense]
MKKHGTSAPLPLNDTLSPGIPLDQIGQTLASFYDDLVSEGMPEHLAALVRRVRQTEDDRVAAAGPVAVAAETDPRRVALVVEDDPAIRALAETLLEETELDVVGCDSAEAALSVLQARGGDVALVFADVRLAGHMDGLQLARAVATLWPRARLVITSGHGLPRPEMPPEAVFIAKPWRPLDVLVEAERATSDPAPPVV